MKCPYCGKENDPQEAFCVDCGGKLSAAPSPTPPPAPTPPPVSPPTPLATGEVECPSCHKTNPAGTTFCIECGADLSQVVPPPPQAVPPPPAELKCPVCSTVSPPEAKFCYKDGTPLVATPAPVAAPAVAAPPQIAKLILPDNSEILLTEATKTLGRGDFSRAISAEDSKYLSRQHFQVSFESGKFYVEDLKSANGTKLNGTDIKDKGKQELKDGDKIEVAEVATVTFKMS